jgi:hypothetical protein
MLILTCRMQGGYRFTMHTTNQHIVTFLHPISLVHKQRYQKNILLTIDIIKPSQNSYQNVLEPYISSVQLHRVQLHHFHDSIHGEQGLHQNGVTKICRQTPNDRKESKKFQHNNLPVVRSHSPIHSSDSTMPPTRRHTP